MKIFKEPLIQRKITCILLGISFGFLCVYLASQGGQSLWGTPVMWNILFNRLLIGFVIFIAGALNYHKIFQFRFFPWLRGFIIGAVVSVDIAIGTLMAPGFDNATLWNMFWLTILSGAIYGLIIDVVATRIAGDGEKLTAGWAK